MTGSQGSKQKKEHGSGRVALSDSISVALFANKFIVKSKFVADYLQHLEVLEFKRKRRAEERQRKVGKQKINHMRIIIKLSCVKM